MQSIIEIIISGNTSGGTAGGVLDLYGNEPINIVYQIASIVDFTKTNSDFTQEFQLPGTKNNNLLFSQIFEISSDSQFDPRKKAKAYILVDSNEVISGNLQLTNIGVDHMDNVIYTVIVYGETSNLFSKIEGKYLTDLDWSEFDHTLDVNTVVSSWSGTWDTTGYFYPFINYGYPWDLPYWQASGNQSSGPTGVTTNAADGQGIQFNQIYPAIYHRRVLEKIITNAGYQIESTILNSTAFTESIMPFNGNPDTLISSAFETGRKFQAGMTPQIATPPMSSYVNNGLPTSALWYYKIPVSNWDTSSSPNFNDGLYFAGSPNDTYSADTPSSQRFTMNVQYEYETFDQDFYTNGFFIQVDFIRTSYNGGGSPFYSQAIFIANPLVDPGTQGHLTGNVTISTPWLNSPANPQYKPLQAGELISCNIYQIIQSYNVIPVDVLVYFSTATPLRVLAAGTFWSNEIALQTVLGSDMEYNNIIPKQILQSDYVKSIVNMYNLLIDQNKNDASKLIIDTRDNYYSSGATIVWTDKLDQKKPIVQTLLSEQKSKQFVFNGAEDADYLNTNYKTATNKLFGQYTYNFDNEFNTETVNISTIFAPTPMENLALSYQTIIPGAYTLDNNNYKRAETKPRFLFRKMIHMYTGEYFVFLTGNTLGSQQRYVQYPYAGHLDDPYNSSLDYNFGAVEYEYYTVDSITQNNLINNYWINYLDSINDKNSRMITAYFFLNAVDIANLDFKNAIQCDGLTNDGAHFFILNSVEYSPTSRGDSYKVELLKLTNKDTDFVAQRYIVKNTGGSSPGQSARMSITMGGDSQTLSQNSINVGNSSIVASPASLSLGSNNTIESSSAGSSVIGSNNKVSVGSTSSVISGDNNLIAPNAPNVMLIGSNNTIMSGSGNNMVVGNGITIAPDVNNINVFASSGGTFTGSNTTYIENVVVMSSITISNVTYGVSGLSLTNYWTAGTGIDSITTLNHGAIASGSSAVAIGSGTTAGGDGSFASGAFTQAIGFVSHSEGASTQANGTASHSEGTTTQANGDHSHAEGSISKSIGDSSHAEGVATQANGNFSHSEGASTQANGTASHAGGFFANASREFEWARSSNITYNSTSQYPQYGKVSLGTTTNNATPKKAFLNFVSGVGNSEFIIETGATFYVQYKIVGVVASGLTKGDSCVFNADGVITNDYSGNTSLLGAGFTITKPFFSVTLSSTTLAIQNNTINQSLDLQVTGVAATDINWFAEASYQKVVF